MDLLRIKDLNAHRLVLDAFAGASCRDGDVLLNRRLPFEYDRNDLRSAENGGDGEVHGIEAGLDDGDVDGARRHLECHASIRTRLDRLA